MKIFSFLLLLSAFAGVFAILPLDEEVEGFATFYGGPQDGMNPDVASYGLVNGACGYGELDRNDWPFWDVVSIGDNNPIAYKGNKKGCGYCIRAECKGQNCGANAQPATLWVTDACKDCADNQLNLDAYAFRKYFNTDLTVGRVNITFQQIDCTPPGDMLVRVVKSRPTLGNYIGVALMAVAGEGTITSVELKGQGDASFKRMENIYGDVWEASQFGDAPLSIRVTDNYGLTLTSENVITSFTPQMTYDTNVQFTSANQTEKASLGPGPSFETFAPVWAPLPVTAEVAVGLSSGFIKTKPGTFCDSHCFDEGLTASHFKKIGTELNTFACGVNDPTIGALTGYQLSNSTATCSVATLSMAKAMDDYACLCQNVSQTQGLQPYNGTECSSACNISIDGLSGTAVPVDINHSSYMCLPLIETSLQNRFGHTVSGSNGEQCVIDRDGQSFAASQFSCFCLFTSSPVSAASAPS